MAEVAGRSVAGVRRQAGRVVRASKRAWAAALHPERLAPSTPVTPRAVEPSPSVEVPVELPVELTDRGSRQVVPTPTGWTPELVRELLESVSIEHAPPGELRAYVTEDFERFLLTWSLVRDEVGRALEIGANPYFTTVLLQEFTELELSLTNSFGATDRATGSQHVTYRLPSTGEIRAMDVVFDHLNVEIDEFPYDDATFDVVLFCEVVEHLVVDPVRALREIQRVLRPGGRLVVSTPNVARLENVGRLAAGANMYDPYSGYGPYGRHNREYTRHELVRLLEFCGFRVEHHFTADVHPHHTSSFVEPSLLEPLLRHRRADLGQYLFAVAENTGVRSTGVPSELYRSVPADQLRSWE